jgi:hypothetical protein
MVSGPDLSSSGFFVGDFPAYLSTNLKKCTKSVQFYTLFPGNVGLGGFKANRVFYVALKNANVR